MPQERFSLCWQLNRHNLRKATATKTMSVTQAMRWAEINDERWLTATHEAGHLAASFFFGGSDCLGIFLAGKRKFYDFYFKSAKSESGPLGKTYFILGHEYPPFRPYKPADAIELLSYRIIETFSGPYAEALIGKGSAANWRSEFVPRVKNGNMSFPNSSDYAKILWAARIAYGTANEQQRFIKKMADWTEDVFCTVGFTTAVTALAERIFTRRKEFTKYTFAKRILSKALGLRPYGFDIRIWQRRFPNFRKLVPRFDT